MEHSHDSEPEIPSPDHCMLYVESAWRLIEHAHVPSTVVLEHLEATKTFIHEHLLDSELDEQTKTKLKNSLVMITAFQDQFPYKPN